MTSNEETESGVTFTTVEAATAARADALKLFNEGDLEGALAIQVAILQCFTTAYGETDARLGPYYLDYGVTMLELIQDRGESPEEAALTPVDTEDAEVCFLNLTAAIRCFDAAEEADEDCADTQERLAEAHGAVAQLYLELDNSEEALKAFETALLYLQNLPEAALAAPKNQAATVAAMFNVARCYLQEADFAGATSKLEEAVAFAKGLPAGVVEAELVEELEEQLADALDNRDNGTYEKAKASIAELFPDESEEVASPEEILAGQETLSTSAAAIGSGTSNPLFSAVPDGGGRTSSLLLAPASIPGSGSHQRPEDSNSMSVSFFPVQGTGERSRSAAFSAGASNSQPVNMQVRITKKAKAPSVTATGNSNGHDASGNGEPSSKKLRAEK